MRSDHRVHLDTPVVRFPQTLNPMYAQRRGHLAEHHGLVLVREGLFGHLERKVHVLLGEVPEEDLDGLLCVAWPMLEKTGLCRLFCSRQSIYSRRGSPGNTRGLGSVVNRVRGSTTAFFSVRRAARATAVRHVRSSPVLGRILLGWR